MSRLPSVPCCADEPPPATANRRIYLPAFVVFHVHAPRGRAFLLLLPVQLSNANRIGQVRVRQCEAASLVGRIPMIYQIQTRTKCKHRSRGICCLRIPPPPIKIVTVLSCGVVPGPPQYSSPPGRPQIGSVVHSDRSSQGGFRAPGAP